MSIKCLNCNEHLPLGTSVDDEPETVAWEVVCFQVADDLARKRSRDLIDAHLDDAGVSPLDQMMFWQGIRDAADGATGKHLAKILEKIAEIAQPLPGMRPPSDPHPFDGVVAFAAGALCHDMVADRVRGKAARL
jgi:hypothetical protein